MKYAIASRGALVAMFLMSLLATGCATQPGQEMSDACPDVATPENASIDVYAGQAEASRTVHVRVEFTDGAARKGKKYLFSWSVLRSHENLKLNEVLTSFDRDYTPAEDETSFVAKAVINDQIAGDVRVRVRVTSINCTSPVEGYVDVHRVEAPAVGEKEGAKDMEHGKSMPAPAADHQASSESCPSVVLLDPYKQVYHAGDSITLRFIPAKGCTYEKVMLTYEISSTGTGNGATKEDTFSQSCDTCGAESATLTVSRNLGEQRKVTVRALCSPKCTGKETAAEVTFFVQR